MSSILAEPVDGPVSIITFRMSEAAGYPTLTSGGHYGEAVFSGSQPYMAGAVLKFEDVASLDSLIDALADLRKTFRNPYDNT